jgi:hypothetical protein
MKAGIVKAATAIALVLLPAAATAEIELLDCIGLGLVMEAETPYVMGDDVTEHDIVLATFELGLEAKSKLESLGIGYMVRQVGDCKANVFFGKEECIDVLARFGVRNLNQLTPEEDFILGVMLGYDCLAQCRRYVTRHRKYMENLAFEEVEQQAGSPFFAG